jgi:BolA protein
MNAPNRAARLEATLRAAFAPTELHVQDDSARHAGHAGAAPGGETHFNVRIVSETFTGLSRVARSRAVNTALASEFSSGLHALSLQLRAPGEDQA